MALNLHDKLIILRSASMQTRITAVVVNFAVYLVNGGDAGNGVDPVNAVTWAKETLAGNADSVAYRVSSYLVPDPNFESGGSGISDANLGGAVETAIKTRFIAPAA